MSEKYTDEELDSYEIYPYKHILHDMEFDDAEKFLNELMILSQKYNVSLKDMAIQVSTLLRPEAIIYIPKTDEELDKEIAEIKETRKILRGKK
jgi:predicted transcriptional regulator